MAFSESRPERSRERYGKQHVAERRKWVARIQRGELVTCHFCGQAITITNGNHPAGLHLDHTEDGTAYRGPSHNACNVKDGARRGAQRRVRTERRRWAL